MTITAQQLFDALKDGFNSGAIDPTDGIHLIKPDGRLVQFYEFDEDKARRPSAEDFELRADGFVLATTQK